MKKSIGAKTIVFPTPAFMVGTYDKGGRPNVMAAAWVEYAVPTLHALPSL